MALIKLNDGFQAEVSAFRSAGAVLDPADPSSGTTGGLSLQTVDAYRDRLSQISQLMMEFRALTQKDAKDMEELAARLNAADNS